MRGSDPKQDGMFSYVSPEQRVPAEHPLRPLRTMVDDILKEMSPRFAKLYADRGRPSIPPERLLRALLLQILYTVRSERLLVEQLNYNLLFRWFVGMGMDEVVWNHAVFSKNRERLLNEEVAEVFFQRVLERAKPYLSDEHFTVDGTLIEAWASHKSFRPKDGGEPPSGNGREVDFHREKRSNETQSIDDRSRCSTVQEIEGQRSEDELPRACADGKSPWAAGGYDGDHRGWNRGARCGRADGFADFGREASDAGRR